ncbi:DMT family transporter [Roseateles microcysteis]|uniref:DMT family transporter n=1 Tax=Roseateles microcysteis TaxID=3119057 RepID=UPI002FE696C5
MSSISLRAPAVRGGVLALLAAMLFGASTPFVQYFGRGLGAFTTASLLYFGAAVIGLLLRRPVEQEARLHRGDWPRLMWVAAFGAVVGPVALAWGLQRTSGAGASLMLTLEALFTALLAWRLYGEVMDRRVWLAMLALLVGGVTLVLDQGSLGGTRVQGMIAVGLATAAWGMDNSLSRALAERDPAQVVMAKSALGAAATFCLALFAGEPLPSPATAAALLAIGASGYGLSLRLYLLAQRAFGAGRTGSVFAFAPFVGALIAIPMGDRLVTLGMVIGGSLMLMGVLLHLAESHAHEHEHEAVEHEHAHRHDDGHHDHVHDPMPTGSHSHRHRHAPVRHSHAHMPDAHHTHRH